MARVDPSANCQSGMQAVRPAFTAGIPTRNSLRRVEWGGSGGGGLLAGCDRIKGPWDEATKIWGQALCAQQWKPARQRGSNGRRMAFRFILQVLGYT